MLRRFPLRVACVRNVYIAPQSTGSRGLRRKYASPKAQELEEKQEAALLDAQLKELKKKQLVLRKKILESRDRELQQKLAQVEGVSLSQEATPEEVNALEKQLSSAQLQPRSKQATVSSQLSNNKSSTLLRLPDSIKKLLPSISKASSIQLFSQHIPIDWTKVILSLPTIPSCVPLSDIEKFMVAIPLKVRSHMVDKLESVVPDEFKSQFIKDQLMAAYAETGRVADVERLIKSCDKPTIFSFAHWAKSLFKAGSGPEVILSVIKSMGNQGLEPTLPVMSTALQSYIQHGRHLEAETLFDNMKYWSVSMMPDLKIYNSMILSAAKQHNVNRCLDLLNEMKERRPFPLQPNQETYNYLVYACARDPKTFIMAWDLFLEAQSLGFSPDRQTFRALLYLCGSSGETLLARALIRNLSEKSPQFIDQYALNCLMLSYRFWKPGPSRILTSPSGQAIRANILMSSNESSSVVPAGPPLLPLAQLSSELILLESNATFEYYADTNPSLLTLKSSVSGISSPALHNFLKISINLSDDISEFKRRFHRFTILSDNEQTRLLQASSFEELGEEDHTKIASSSKKSMNNAFDSLPTAEHPKFTIERDHFLYRLAIHAATKFKDLEFGRKMWTERGQWRRTEAFRKLSKDERNNSDFQFARDLVELLAVCGCIEEALLLVKSAQNLHKWRKHHLTALLAACEQLEDFSSINEITRIVRST